jgi:hypothetical protein
VAVDLLAAGTGLIFNQVVALVVDRRLVLSTSTAPTSPLGTPQPSSRSTARNQRQVGVLGGCQQSPLPKRTTGMSPPAAKSVTALRNPSPIRSKIAGDGIGYPRCAGQETHHLTRNLRGRHPPVEIDPVKTLQLQPNMPIEDVVHPPHESP